MKTSLPCVVLAMVSAGVFACGGGTGPSGAAPAATDDAGEEGGPVTTPVEAGVPMEAATPPINHGAPSTTYPAFPVTMGQLANGGVTMTAPVIVAITWNDDPSQAYYDTFADTLGGTAYWNATSSEWGIAPVISGTVNHVHIATAIPATLADSDLQSMVTTNAGAVGGWPAATSNTIYAFFLAPGTSLNLGAQGGGGGGSGDACSQGVGGYHDQVNVGSVTTAYAVVDSCNLMITPSAADQTTASMSHEINEAASDPQPMSNAGGVIGFANDSFAFDYFMLPLIQSFSTEDGDACEIFLQSFYDDIETAPPFNYWVQRIWSNKSAAAGHDPCVPVAAAPYFNVTPLNVQTVNVNLPAELTGTATTQQQPTNGFKVLAGTTGTFAVGFYSDAAMGAWKISVDTNNPITGTQGLGSFNTASVTASLDRTSGQNGDIAYVTVKVATSGSTFKGEVVTITSSLEGIDHYMPIWIAGQ